ncbi:MAG: ketosteroid isomerase [Alphaproteobacteria bacterium]|nr:ketosteroid isomerase [Alphaproteobacteria bacterium]
MSASLDAAARFFAAVEAHDAEGVRAAYAPDARIWHNIDGVGAPGQTVDENLRVLLRLWGALADMRYEIVRRETTETGFVQQHVLRARIQKTGETFAMPACIVCVVQDGRIARLDEYVDSGQAAALVAALA